MALLHVTQILTFLYDHGSLEGVGDVITSGACPSKADISVILETFFKSIDALFQENLVCQIHHLSHFPCATGNTMAGTRASYM